MDVRAVEFAHDVKMPIQLICSCVQLLEMELPGNARAEGYLRMLMHSAGQLQMMVRNVLDEDKLQRGCGGLHLTERDLAADVKEIAMECDLYAREQGKRVCFFTNAAPLNLITDGEKLERMLQNLIANALKVTPEGEAVSVRLRAMNDAVELDVVDCGPGIAIQRQAQIFEPGQSSGGDGYGLGIVRAYARMLGGDVILDSAPGRGSRFTIHFRSAGPTATCCRA